MSDSVRPHRRQPTRLPCPLDSPGKNTGVGCHFLLQCVKVKLLSRVRLLATPWTAAHQAPPSMGFSRQEYWSGVPLPSPFSNTTVNTYGDNPKTKHILRAFSLGIVWWRTQNLDHRVWDLGPDAGSLRNGYETLGKWASLSEPQFPQVWNAGGNVAHFESLSKDQKTMHVPFLLFPLSLPIPLSLSFLSFVVQFGVKTMRTS